MSFAHPTLGKRVVVELLLSAAMVCVLTLSSHARGGAAQEDRWHARHVSWLPREIQNAVLQYQAPCGSLAATHQFALSLDGGPVQLIALHYENFRCDNRRAICSNAGCLHEIFASRGGTYRLVQRIYASDIELKLVNQRPALAVERSAGKTQIMVWNGRRFVAP